MVKKSIGVLAFIVAVAPAWSAVTYQGSSGNLAAEAIFDVSGNNLVITLSNISLFDVVDPAELLTGVYFDYSPTISSVLSLTRVSAILTTGSTVVFGTSETGGVVGGEWAYKSGLSGPGGTDYGISSAGLGLFGPTDRFPGGNLQGPDDPDGPQYGITSKGDNTASGNAAVTGSNALIQYSVTFTLSGLPEKFSLDDIDNVYFQYGTALTEPSFPGTTGTPPSNIVPSPAAFLPFGLGLLSALRRKRN